MEETEYQGSLIDTRLSILYRKGGFLSVYLLSKEGLALGGTITDYDRHKMVETSKLVIAIIETCESKLGFSFTDEISFVDDNNTRLVLRPFLVGKKNPQILILVVTTMLNQPYRMLTTKAISKIKKLWEDIYE